MARQGRRHDRPSRTKSHPSGSLSSSHPGRPPCWASPLAFGLTVPYPHVLALAEAPHLRASGNQIATANVFNRWSSLTLMAGRLPHYFTRPMLPLWGVTPAWVGGASCLPAVATALSSSREEGKNRQLLSHKVSLKYPYHPPPAINPFLFIRGLSTSLAVFMPHYF
jgi:hypothetical protein